MVNDIGTWGRGEGLNDRWWEEHPPTVLMIAPNGPAQEILVAVLLGLGYRSDTDYVFGARIDGERFHTGSYESGPIEWLLRSVGRRPKLEWFVAARAKGGDKEMFDRLCGWVPQIHDVVDQVEESRILDLIDTDNLSHVTEIVLQLLKAVSEVGVNDDGYVWPPLKVGAGWAARE